MENISKHISYHEATHSENAVRHSINNNPNIYQLAAMKVVAIACFEQARAHFGATLFVTSFFRCEALNSLIGGAAKSQHTKGQAIDFTTGNPKENYKLYCWMRDNLHYDQLIAENVNEEHTECQWIHVSYIIGANREACLLKIRSRPGYFPDTVGEHPKKESL